MGDQRAANCCGQEDCVMSETAVQSDDTAKVREYWERASCGTTVTEKPKFSRDYFDEIEAFRYKHEPCIHTFAQFSRWHGKKVLEIGVGAGTDFLQFARAGARVHGVDLTDEAISNVGHRLQEYGLAAEDLRRCNAEELPYENDTFDLAYSWGVIHHAENMEKVFDEMYRVTRPGGRVKIMVYNLISFHVLALYLRYAVLTGKLHRGPRWAAYHHLESYGTKVYTRSAIRRMLRSYPHTELQFHFWNPVPRPDRPLARLRSLVDRVAPPETRWFLAFEFVKTR
jgi:ubiquinone/menaquinone biosynthesis C-methylase UbiE